jgi:glutamate dehydrogenase/leucine dehydrogenase
MVDLASLTPAELVARLVAEQRRRAYFVFDRQREVLVASHEDLDPLARALESDQRDFDRHDAIFLEVGRESGALLGAFLHRTVRGQAQGGLRNWPYDTVLGFLRDGMRLARGMGRKNALAGLWWGGGKGIIARPAGLTAETRGALYRDFGRFTSSLRGAYVTAEDVGTTASDMAQVFRTTRFVTCVPPAVGGSGNPSKATARGVVCAMEAALDFLELGSLEGKTIAMQGVGNVGRAMLSELFGRKAKLVVATDIDERRVSEVKAAFEGLPLEISVRARGDNSVLETQCDILAPNALGGVLSEATIPRIQARIVCGAANNQLLDEQHHDQLLLERGITYVPDFVANRMGIVNCANEQYGVLPHDPALERHFGREWDGSVYDVTRRVLELAEKEMVTPAHAATKLADQLSEVPHPIWGDRTHSIIESLVASRWHEAAIDPEAD